MIVETRASGTGTRDYLDNYFEQVVAIFNQRLQDNGISSLPVNDVYLDINRTVASQLYLGTINYTNGALVEVSDIILEKEGHRGQPEDDGVHLFYQFTFQNMSLFSDVAVSLNNEGRETGTADLLFLNTSIGVYFDKNYTLGTTSVETKPYATMGPATLFLPVSDTMDVAARLARLELGYRMLWDQVAVWCNSTFTDLVKTITQEIEFPIFPPQS